jgi:hypothetical protein
MAANTKRRKLKTKRGIDRIVKSVHQAPRKRRASTRKTTAAQKLSAKKGRIRRKARATAKDVHFDKVRSKHLAKRKSKKKSKKSKHKFLSALGAIGHVVKKVAGKITGSSGKHIPSPNFVEHGSKSVGKTSSQLHKAQADRVSARASKTLSKRLATA